MSEDKIKNSNLVEWIDGETPVSAVHLNAIKNKVISNSDDINTLSNSMLNLQSKNDNNLQTTNKNVVGAINELRNNKFDKVTITGNILKFYANNIEKSSITLPKNQEVDLSEINNALATKYDNVTLEGQNLKFYVGSVLKKTISLPVGEGGNVDLSAYQTINDSTLTTENKTIVGAINEISSDTSQNSKIIESLILRIEELEKLIPEKELPIIPESELPSDFPKFTVKGKTPYEGEFYMCPHNPNCRYIFIIDHLGRVRWFKKLPNFAYGFKKHTNSKGKTRYIYSLVTEGFEEFPKAPGGHNQTTLYIMDENFREIETLRLKAAGTIPEGHPSECHENLFIDDGHYVITGYVKNTINNIPGNSNSYVVCNNVIQEVKNGEVIFHWESIDYPELYTISVEGYPVGGSGDYAHLNAVIIDPKDNNFICSFRNSDSIIKINRTTGDIIWIMGGLADQFKLTEEQKWKRQHNIMITETGSYTLFDNRINNEPSRIVEFEVDEVAKTISKFRAYSFGEKWGQFMGSTTKLNPNKDTYCIGWGSSSGGEGTQSKAMSEINFETNNELFSLSFDDGSDIYRAFRIVTKYNPEYDITPEPPPAQSDYYEFKLKDESNENSSDKWYSHDNQKYFSLNKFDYTSTSGWTNEGLKFDGTKSFLKCIDDELYNSYAEFSLELLIKPNLNNNSRRVLLCRNSGKIQLWIAGGIPSADGKKVVLNYKDGTSDNVISTDGDIIEKTHVVITVKNKIAKLYFNGVLVGELSSNNHTDLFGDYFIGSYNGTSRYDDSEYLLIKHYKTELSGGQVLERYNTVK